MQEHKKFGPLGERLAVCLPCFSMDVIGSIVDFVTCRPFKDQTGQLRVLWQFSVSELKREKGMMDFSEVCSHGVFFWVRGVLLMYDFQGRELWPTPISCFPSVLCACDSTRELYSQEFESNKITIRTMKDGGVTREIPINMQRPQLRLVSEDGVMLIKTSKEFEYVYNLVDNNGVVLKTFQHHAVLERFVRFPRATPVFAISDQGPKHVLFRKSFGWLDAFQRGEYATVWDDDKSMANIWHRDFFVDCDETAFRVEVTRNTGEDNPFGQIQIHKFKEKIFEAKLPCPMTCRHPIRLNLRILDGNILAVWTDSIVLLLGVSYRSS